MEKMIPVVTSVGDEVMRHYRTDFKITQKNPGSFYSEVDLLSQKMLQEKLQEIIPGSGYIAEELEVYDKKDFTWVIDPIDGTRNFVRGMPYFGISVALLKYDEIIAAVVYMPAMSDMISAQKGMGLWVNGQRFSTDFTRYQQEGVMIVSGSIKQGKRELALGIKQVLKDLEHGIRFRACGAAAVDLAYAAIGVYDAVLFENLKWWDVAAGILLVTEAGGHVSDYQNRSIDESFKTLIAGNKAICIQILDAGIL